MKKRIKKIKIKLGKDANQMIVRKLIKNFIASGRLIITQKKAKVLKSELDLVISKALKNTESGKNVLLKKIGDIKIVRLLTDEIAPSFKGRVGGYVRSEKLYFRDNDGSSMVKLEWTTPVARKDKQEKKEPSKENKTADVVVAKK